MSSPRLLSNRYEIGDAIGYGGMSEVHRGRDIRLGRDVAVKVLRADLARDPTFQIRFRREAQNAAALNHPAIVAVYDTGETDSESGPLPYIVMEYVDGRTLRDIVKSEGPLPSRRAMEVMADASAALDFSHRHGIVHRDVKPANIMITGSGAVKVMDFGIARALAGGQAAVTQTAAVIGTAQYLSPEQARGESVDARSDVYAAGCVLFELLTGEPPFTGDSPVAVAYQHVREEPRAPSELNSQVPASLDAVVLKALSKNPANRYQSAAEMRSDLVRVLSGQRPKAPMVMSEEERTSLLTSGPETEMMPTGRHRSEPEEMEPEPERKRRKGWIIALVTLLCVAAFAGVWALANNVFSPPEETRYEVPDLVGKPRAEAISILTARNWRHTINSCPSSPQQVGMVTSQRPSAGTMRTVKQVTLCVGNGPKQVQIPDLAGKTPDEATRLLENAGLVPGDTTEEEIEDPSQVGMVIDWEPRGNAVPEGTKINLVIGKEVESETVPNVVGQQFSSAQQQLQGLGFSVHRVDQDSDQPAGTVISQQPGANTEANPNSAVTLTVSKGNMIAMPSLQGMSASEAESTLRSAGWNGSIQQQTQTTSNEDWDDKVVNTSPGAGSQVRKDQTITLYIGEYSSSPTETTDPGNGDGLFPPFR